MMSVDYILDASALLALLQEEPGADIVSKHLSASAISSVNLAEAASVLNHIGMPEDEIYALFQEMDIKVLSFEKETAIATGGIRAVTEKSGLSLGDRACLITAKQQNCIVLTADKMWLAFHEILVEIILIR